MNRVGIIGGGQLGRMLAQASAELGIECLILDPDPACCAGQVAPVHVGSLDDMPCLAAFAEQVDVVTYEHENVPTESLEVIAESTDVAPGVTSLKLSQDRLLERSLLSACEVDQPKHASVDGLSTLNDAIKHVGAPGFLKRRRGGYDGRGQTLVQSTDDAAEAWNLLGSTNCVYEALVSFDRELSILGLRDRSGHKLFYPLIESLHDGGILIRTRAPAPGAIELQSGAEEIASRVVDTLDHVGAFALELFDVGGRLLANEFAGRVHNTGHWTIEGAETSQFSNHIRAITGMPLGATAATGFAITANVLGEIPGPLQHPETLPPNLHVHLYGKKPAPRRKIGHATIVCAKELDALDAVGVMTSLIGPRHLDVNEFDAPARKR